MPRSDHLRSVGLLNPLNASHHMRTDEWCTYREGVTIKRHGKDDTIVDVGLDRFVTVAGKDASLNTRVTVKMPESSRVLDKPIGELVSPREPREELGRHQR